MTELKTKPIIDMEPGEEGYAVPWAFYPKATPGGGVLLFVRGDYDVALIENPLGTLTVHIRMSDNRIVELLDSVDSVSRHLSDSAPLHLDWKWVQVRPTETKATQ